MEKRITTQVIPINWRSQKMASANQEELRQFNVSSEQERFCRLIDDYIAYLKGDNGHGSLRAVSTASIRHQKVVLAGFLLWVQWNLREAGE